MRGVSGVTDSVLSGRYIATNGVLPDALPTRQAVYSITLSRLLRHLLGRFQMLLNNRGMRVGQRFYIRIFYRLSITFQR